MGSRFSITNTITFFLVTLLAVFYNSPLYAIQHHTSDSLRVKHLLDSAYALESVSGDNALRVYAEAIRVSREINYVLGEAKALHYSGIVYSDKSMYPEALERYRQAVTAYRRINYSRGIGACFINVGNVYRFQSKLDSSLVNYQKALQILIKNNHIDALSQAYGNAGGVFQELKQYERAFEYHSESVRYATLANDSVVLCRALINQGTVLNDLKRLDESLATQMKAMTIAENLHDDYSLQLTNINVADHYRQLRQYPLAIRYGMRSLQYALKLGTPYDVADIKKRVGDLYAGNREYDKAKALYLDAILLSEGIRATEISVSAYRALHNTHALLGDFRQAYKYLGLEKQYQDSILGEKQLKSINELEVRYRTLQKDEELARRQLQLQQSRQYVVYSFGAALILLLSILLLAIGYFNRKRNHRRKLQEIEREKKIQVFQAVMQGEEKERIRIAHDLHDGVAGMLAAAKMHLTSMALVGPAVMKNSSYHQAVSLLDDASTSVRKTAHNLLPEILMLYGLDKALQRYCSSISNDKQLTIQYDSWGETARYADNFELSVYRIVQELLNNIIKHSKATEAIVQLSSRDSILSITVEDNGVGFTAEKLIEEGVGIASLRSRVQIMRGKIDIVSNPGEGVSIYIEFDTKGLEVTTGTSAMSGI